MRVTEKDLAQSLKVLNNAMGFKGLESSGKGKGFIIGMAYGGYRLEFTNTRKGSGVRDVSPRMTKKELYTYIDAMLEGVYYYKNRTKM